MSSIYAEDFRTARICELADLLGQRAALLTGTCYITVLRYLRYRRYLPTVRYLRYLRYRTVPTVP